MKRAAIATTIVSLVGCAAADKQAPRAPEATAPAGYPQESAGAQAQPQPYPSAPPQAESTMPVVPAQPGTPGTFAPPPPSPEMSRATQDFETGRRDLESSLGQCKDACRALSSMDRAAGKICGLEPGGRCDDAKQKLYTARDRVRSSCGTCQDGTTTDRNAPVPSR